MQKVRLGPGGLNPMYSLGKHNPSKLCAKLSSPLRIFGGELTPLPPKNKGSLTVDDRYLGKHGTKQRTDVSSFGV